MWHDKLGENVLSELKTSISAGLTEEEVLKRRATYGFNELAKPEGKSLFSLILEQFEDLMVIILLVAAVISTLIALLDKEEGILGFVEPIVILLILIANAAVGVWQESNAEAALEALKDLQSEHARVLRDKEWKTILAKELVPGDIIEVTVGNKSPADVRVVKLLTPSLKVEQSSLTGEAEPISKHAGICKGDSYDQQSNILFSSTSIASGAAIAVVVEIGMKTAIGKIQSLVEAGQAEESKTPLEEKLDEFGNLLAKVIFAICLLVWVMNYKNFYDEIHGSVFRGAIYYFKIAVALAVAAVPEGLPAVITTCLALGTRRMAKRNAIVMKLPSVETLGCTTIICSDKTGTLTTNEMTVTNFFIPSAKANEFDNFTVTGHSFDPSGEVQDLKPEHFSPVLKHFTNTMHFCNSSMLENVNGRFKITGMATEGALRVLVEKLKHNLKAKTGFFSDLEEKDIKKIVALEFTSERKSMSMLCSKKNSSNILYTKGAPEQIIERSSYILLPSGEKVVMSGQLKDIVLENCSKFASEGLRCLALAYKDQTAELSDYKGPEHHAHKTLENPKNFLAIESQLTFLGVIAMRDPPRPEVQDAIKLCKKAGIRVFMITGDNKITAEAIARKVGIMNDSTLSLTGIELATMKDDVLKSKLKKSDSCVFSRTSPENKYRLVCLLKELNEIVAMTGDGVNDAPALKAANIGVAMGIAGTEVAKSASDMVLADDKFSTIVAAVEEGRSIYNNTKAFIRYLISSNIGEVVSIFLTAMLGLPEGFTSVQLLWVNLVTDGPPATALGFNPPDLEIMNTPPRKSDEPLITNWVFFRYFVIGTYVGAATVGVFVYWYLFFESTDGHPLVSYAQLSNWSECPGWKDFKLANWGGLDLEKNPCLYFTEGKIKASTLSLSVLVTIEMFNALNALSEDGSLLHMPPWVNLWLLLAISVSMTLHCVILYVPFFNEIFGILPLDWKEWQLVLAFSIPVTLIDEILKFVSRMSSKKVIPEKKEN